MYSESGYVDSKISLEWLRRVFDPQTKERAGSRSRVLICDGFGTHETLKILEYCFANDIILCRLPSHTSHKLQPCDIAVFAPLKAAYRDNVERMERGGVDTIGKQHFTSLYSPARELAFSEKNIVAGWSKAGLFPFNPDRVLSDMPKLPSEITGNGRERAVSIRYTPLRTPLTPVTPVTPMSADALMSLQTLIVQRDARTLDERSKLNLEKHLQKLTKAASILFAKSALQQDQIQFLLKINNESKRRCASKSIVLGKAKVMSYNDLVAARAKRAEMEAAKARKLKSNRPKHQGDMLDMNAPDQVVEVSHSSEGTDAAGKVMQWSAPVARMY